MIDAAPQVSVKPSLPVVLTVEERIRESDEAVTLCFRRPDAGAALQGLALERFRPGQFFMVWIPRLDEKPYAVSRLDSERVEITVQPRGPFSRRLAAMRPGAMVGLRGPFGRGFWHLDRYQGSDRVALIGGGCGMAVLAPLAERLNAAHVVQGARTAGGLLYRERFPQQVFFTDDGSAGRKGFPSQWLQEAVADDALHMVYTCGPELMMKAVEDVCRGSSVDCQVCLERYMKCGIGVCGQCDCDGRRVCVEGPVFELAELTDMPSFGRHRRDRTGRITAVTTADRCPAAPAPPGTD